MTDTERWKRETLAYGHSIIRTATKDVDKYEPYVHSNGLNKFLNIYSTETHDSVLCIQAPTYYDLFIAAQAALNTVRFVEREKLGIL